MSYKASPRPAFAGPAPIPYASVTRHLWGDDASGEVADWIYVSNDKIHQLVFGLPPGGAFRHSDAYRTVFAADEVLLVLSGTMVLANPETGEVHRLLPGEAAFVRRDTWHHAWSYGTDALRVLEFVAPPPTSSWGPATASTCRRARRTSTTTSPTVPRNWSSASRRRTCPATRRARPGCARRR